MRTDPRYDINERFEILLQRARNGATLKEQSDALEVEIKTLIAKLSSTLEAMRTEK